MPAFLTAKPPVALTIAGFDPSSGAGITADLAVFAAHGVFGTSAITLWTVQSTMGVAATEEPAPELLSHTLQHLAADLPPAGIKIGALGNREIAEKVSFFLEEFSRVPIVFDPVLSSSSGKSLFQDADINSLHELILSRVAWITPNWRELSLLTGLPAHTPDEVEAAVAELATRHPGMGIVATGGDQGRPLDLLRTASGHVHWLDGEHIESTSTHGTGCAFSSALLANVIHGHSSVEAVKAAKNYVAEAIRRAPGLGHGRGPLDLLWPLRTGREL